MQSIRLDEHALQIQLAQQLFEYSQLMVFPVGIPGLADRQTQRRRVERYLGNERRPATCCGFDRAAQGFIIAGELSKPSATPGIWAIVQSRMVAHSDLTSICREKYRNAVSDGERFSSIPRELVRAVWWRVA